MNCIGIDLGGTKITAAVFDPSGNILIKVKDEIGLAEGSDVGQAIVLLLHSLIPEAISRGIIISSIGICVPGIAHPSGHVWAPNIPGWENYPLKSELEKSIKPSLPVFVDSDRACHMLGEMWKGAAKGCRDAIFLTVGTGIGAGILVNGQILRGTHDISGAIGWMALNPEHLPPYESRGCFESHCSGYGIVQRAKYYMSTGMDSPYLKNIRGPLTTAAIFEAYDHQDKVSVRVIDEAIVYLGMASANLVSLFNPEKIIFGGGVFGPAIKFLDRIYDEALRWAQPVSIKQVRFEPSQLDNTSGLIGAGYLAMNKSSF